MASNVTINVNVSPSAVIDVADTVKTITKTGAVDTVNLKTGDVTLAAEDVGAIPSTTDAITIPSSRVDVTGKLMTHDWLGTKGVLYVESEDESEYTKVEDGTISLCPPTSLNPTIYFNKGKASAPTNAIYEGTAGTLTAMKNFAVGGSLLVNESIITNATTTASATITSATIGTDNVTTLNVASVKTAPSSGSSSAYTAGTDGQALMTNGSETYWGDVATKTALNTTNSLLNTEMTTRSQQYATLNESLSQKQDALVSGTNIKTVNGNSLLGSGNIVISGGGGGGAVDSVNGQTGTVVLDADDVGALPTGYHDATKQDVLTDEDKQAIADLHEDSVTSVNGETGAVELTIPTVPSTLPNPYALTLTGAVEATYDGSEAVSVTIPEGGGSSGWTKIVDVDITSDVTTISYDMSAYSEFVCIIDSSLDLRIQSSTTTTVNQLLKYANTFFIVCGGQISAYTARNTSQSITEALVKAVKIESTTVTLLNSSTSGNLQIYAK